MLDNLRWSDLASFAFKAGENANKGVSKLAEKSDIFENFENFENFNFFSIFEFKIKSNQFINATALRASPAVTRLTVHRRLQVIPGRMPFGLICRLRNLVPGNRTEAISRNLIITIV